MRIVLKYLMYLVVLAGLGVVGYAIFSDLPAPTRDVVVPIRAATGE